MFRIRSYTVASPDCGGVGGWRCYYYCYNGIVRVEENDTLGLNSSVAYVHQQQRFRQGPHTQAHFITLPPPPPSHAESLIMGVLLPIHCRLVVAGNKWSDFDVYINLIGFQLVPGPELALHDTIDSLPSFTTLEISLLLLLHSSINIVECNWYNGLCVVFYLSYAEKTRKTTTAAKKNPKRLTMYLQQTMFSFVSLILLLRSQSQDYNSLHTGYFTSSRIPPFQSIQ